ncbi:hypothetical protein RQP46_004554 [Phenoliferia psychrophenolica]
MAHEKIEADEEEKVREFQGLPADGSTPTPPEVSTPDSPDSPQKVLQAQTPPSTSSPQVVAEQQRQTAEEVARQERATYARAQAAKFGKDAREASQRGEWGADGDAFKRPKDAADRLRKAIPYKYRTKKSFWGEF